jgi:hypothetical protein
MNKLEKALLLVCEVSLVVMLVFMFSKMMYGSSFGVIATY